MPDTFFYEIDALVLTLILFGALLAALAFGFWLGRRARATTDETAKSQSSTMQGAIIGVLALLLAFTLSMAITRYEARRQLVLEEANAIGTTYLRAKLLPEPYAAQAAKVLRQYVDNRLEFYNAGVDAARLQADIDRAGQLQRQLWAIATAVSTRDNRSIPAGLFVETLNGTIDLQAKRLAATRNKVPEIVILLLFAVSIATATIVGYNSGLSNQRRLFAAVLLIVLITLIIWVLIDLDRPRRGLILISQQSMIDLQQAIIQNRP
jgi:FtsH-binding integral membrane protein